MDDLHRGLVDVIRAFRVGLSVHETEIQDKIEDALAMLGVYYDRECWLGKRSRIDFLIDGRIGIEVKRGKPPAASIQKQIERYCAFADVESLILVSERGVHVYDGPVNGKQVSVVALMSQWGMTV